MHQLIDAYRNRHTVSGRTKLREGQGNSRVAVHGGWDCHYGILPTVDIRGVLDCADLMLLLVEYGSSSQVGTGGQRWRSECKKSTDGQQFCHRSLHFWLLGGGMLKPPNSSMH